MAATANHEDHLTLASAKSFFVFAAIEIINSSSLMTRVKVESSQVENWLRGVRVEALLALFGLVL